MSTKSPSTSAMQQSATIYAAMELSSTKWLVAVQAPDRDKQLERLQTADGHPLPPRLKAEISPECERLH